MERGIEGTFFHAEDIVGDPLDVESYTPAMHGFLLETFQDEKRQASLKGVVPGLTHRVSPRYL
jgi:hypothetical protein